MFAFSLGFFETFSPCLIIMLLFILGYTLSDSIRSKEGFFKVMICIGALMPFFGIGIFAGSILKLSRKAYRHKSVLRGLSDMILIGYALYLVLLIYTSYY